MGPDWLDMNNQRFRSQQQIAQASSQQYQLNLQNMGFAIMMPQMLTQFKVDTEPVDPDYEEALKEVDEMLERWKRGEL